MVPAAIYSVSMYVLATAFGFLVLGRQPAVAAARVLGDHQRHLARLFLRFVGRVDQPTPCLW
jgi:hypothetical protein